MATVHFGRLLGPVGFARTVAIKRLHEHLARDPEFVSMFLDEARLAARIRHPNVVPTFDVVALHGELFLVMEYVQGESLARLLRAMAMRKVSVPPSFAATLVAGVLHGLHAAHEATNERGEPLGIVHRDVSPQNILVGVDGIARLFDFGVAKASGRVHTTRDGQVKGKVSYMPPEQLAGKAADRTADIYAMGAVLWEALTSRRLFDGETEAEIITKKLGGGVEPPSRYAPDVPLELDEAVMKALEHDPAHRYATARDMARALERTCPLASASEIGEWVERCAGSELATRAAHVARIESSEEGGELAALAPPRASEPPIGRTTSTGKTAWKEQASASASAAKRYRLAAMLASAAAVALVGVIIVLLQGESRGRSQPQPASTPPREEPQESARETDPMISLDEPQASVASSAVASSSAHPQGTSKVPGGRPSVTRGAKCNPPYEVDANGNRRYKRECLR
jgi:serine/threonine-protein kinase